MFLTTSFQALPVIPDKMMAAMTITAAARMMNSIPACPSGVIGKDSTNHAASLLLY
jgi:hypothetical protein